MFQADFIEVIHLLNLTLETPTMILNPGKVLFESKIVQDYGLSDIILSR